LVLQILNTFFKFLFFKPTREVVIHQTQMVSIVLELLSDRNPNIRGLVNTILDYVMIYDDGYKAEIKNKRFLAHNQIYLQIMEEYEKQYPLGEEEAMYDMYYDNQLGQEEEGEIDGFDSDEALFFDNNDLASRVWEDND